MNLAILMGRTTKDIELKTTASGTSVTSFTLAVDKRVKKGEDKQADFINIVAWRQTAEFAANYIRKGQLIAIEGSIQTRKYQDKEGKDRTVFEVVANQIHFAEAKRDNGGSSYTPANTSNANINPDNGDFSEFSSEDDLPFN